MVVQPGGHLINTVGSRPRPRTGHIVMAGSGVAGAAGWLATAGGGVMAAAPVPGGLAVGAGMALTAATVGNGRTLARYGRDVLAVASSQREREREYILGLWIEDQGPFRTRSAGA